MTWRSRPRSVEDDVALTPAICAAKAMRCATDIVSSTGKLDSSFPPPPPLPPPLIGCISVRWHPLTNEMLPLLHVPLMSCVDAIAPAWSRALFITMLLSPSPPHARVDAETETDARSAAMTAVAGPAPAAVSDARLSFSFANMDE